MITALIPLLLLLDREERKLRADRKLSYREEEYRAPKREKEIWIKCQYNRCRHTTKEQCGCYCHTGDPTPDYALPRGLAYYDMDIHAHCCRVHWPDKKFWVRERCPNI